MKHEAGSGSEKENNEARAEKKRKRATSCDSEDNVDPDFTPKTPGKATKSSEIKREHKDKEKRREKEKSSALTPLKKKKKDRDKERDRDREGDREKEKSKSSHNGEKERTHDSNTKKEKSDKPEPKISFKVGEPQSFEKLITETAGAVNGTGSAKKSEKSLEERRNMSQLFPGQIKADNVKKKLALTPHSSPKQSSASSQQRTPLKSSDSTHTKKQPESPVKKILNFDNPAKSANILDQIMSNMSFPVNKD